MTRQAPVRRRWRDAGIVLLLGLGAGCSGAVLDGTQGGKDSPGNTGNSGSGGSGNSASPSPSGSGGNTPPPVVTVDDKGVPMCQGTPLAPAARLWRLTHRQYKNTLSDAFGFSTPSVDTLPSGSRLDGFANASERLTLSSALFDYYSRIAEEVSVEAVKRAGDLLGCPVASLGTGTCLADFLNGVGAKAWRRPLSAEEVTKLTKLYSDAAGDVGPEEGFKMVVQGLLLSTNFLFRTELGAASTGVTKLTDFELASALSYMLIDGPPDAELIDLAKKGQLSQPETLGKQAVRLYGNARAPEAMFSFVQQWLEIEDFLNKPKDMMTFPTFTADVAKDLEDETRTFVKATFFDSSGDRSFKTLLTAPYGYLNARTAKLYGKDDGPADNTLARTDLDPSQRRGLLTQATFLAAHAEPVNTSVVARGRFIREEVLCNDVPPPPAEFKFDEKFITEDMTAREKFTEHSKNPACKACHALFDTLGFALENYDAVGRWRTTEKGKMIDPTGTITLPSGGQMTFKNFVDMIDQLGKGNDASDCFASQFVQYVSGRVKLDDCDRANAIGAFRASGYKLDALVAAIVKSSSFVSRSN
jgi:hypothetical protein